MTKNVSFNSASEASYVYILSRQKFIKTARNSRFVKFLKILRPNSIARQATFKWQKIAESAKIEKFKCDIFGDFETLWICLFSIKPKLLQQQ